MSKIILDLCGGTGSWSMPYVEAGYDVRLITSPEYDVRYYYPFDGAYGVLAAPPCTVFSLAGNRWKRTPEEWKEALDVVYACLRIIDTCEPTFWCLENPVGKLSRFLGEPAMRFHPCDYGDRYTKHTALWGRFIEPVKKPVFPRLGSLVWHTLRKPEERAKTPQGFARAFFEANR